MYGSMEVLFSSMESDTYFMRTQLMPVVCKIFPESAIKTSILKFLIFLIYSSTNSANHEVKVAENQTLIWKNIAPIDFVSPVIKQIYAKFLLHQC